jgi:hypothetical protein
MLPSPTTGTQLSITLEWAPLTLTGVDVKREVAGTGFNFPTDALA